MSIYTAGLHNVGSFQVSGMPFTSGSVDASTAVSVQFPYVTRWLYVVNNGAADVRVGFSQLGVEGTNYFTVHATASGKIPVSPRLELKITEVWLSGSDDVDVVAGLTTVPVDRITAISPSGSNWSGSAGVG